MRKADLDKSQIDDENSRLKISDYFILVPFALMLASPLTFPVVSIYRAYSSGFVSAYNEKLRQCENSQDSTQCKREFGYYVLNLSHGKNRDLKKVVEEIENYNIK